MVLSLYSIYRMWRRSVAAEKAARRYDGVPLGIG